MSLNFQRKEKGKNVILAVLIFFIIVVLFFHGFIQRFININIFKKNDIIETKKIQIEYFEDYQLELTNETIMLLNENILKMYDLDGNRVYEERLSSNLNANLGQTGIIIYDRNKEKIFKLNDKIEKLWSLDYFNDFTNIYLCNEDIFLPSNSTLNIITKDGNILAEIELETLSFINGYINNGKIIISNIDISSGNVEGKLNSYDLNGDLIHSNTFENQIIQKVNFINDNIIVITEDLINNVKDEKTIWSKKLEGILVDSITYKDDIYILCDNSLRSIDKSGRLNFSKKLDKEYSQIEIDNNKIFLIGKNSIKIYDINGNLINDYDSYRDLRKALIYNDKIILLREHELVFGKLKS